MGVRSGSRGLYCESFVTQSLICFALGAVSQGLTLRILCYTDPTYSLTATPSQCSHTRRQWLGSTLFSTDAVHRVVATPSRAAAVRMGIGGS